MTHTVTQASLHARLRKIAIVLRFLGDSLDAKLARRRVTTQRPKQSAFSEQVPEGITYII